MPTEEEPKQSFNVNLHQIANECEAKLPEEERGKVKILIDTDTHRLAALQIGEIRISLSREEKPQSLFYPNTFTEALILARNGYSGTGRYIPVPQEVRCVMQNRKVINVYLKALGLEQIPEDANFFCLAVQTGWDTGWKRFNWDIDIAFNILNGKQRVLNKDGNLTDYQGQEITLFLLLKGWEHLFTEV